MAVTYGELPQHDNDDDDRNDDLSPPASLSPALSSSPMPFLPAVESTFTPLSMDSDLYPGVGVGSGVGEAGEADSRDSHKNVGSTATTRASISISAMVQSLSPIRATRNHRSEYGPLSPDSAPSSTSSSPHPNNSGSTPDLNFNPERNLTSKNIEYDHNKSKATTTTPAGKSRGKELVKDPLAQRQQDVQQPIIIKPKPIVRTASTKSVHLRHPTPDLITRSSSYATNIAQLEATAEKLSMTSSIEDAIRDLHEEQKRNDSRRSSILAASIGSIPENTEPVSFTGSIIETNSTARYGGYSPASYFMSPNPSLLSNPTRLRSGSGGLTRSEVEAGSVLSRHGPGKSSVRSVRSATKPTLTDIAEMEPTALTSAAMDEADRLAEEPEDAMLRLPQMEDADLTPNAGRYETSNVYDYWNQAVTDTRQDYKHHDDGRPRTSGSTGTYEQAQMAFADFDGAHCPSEVDLEDSLFIPSFSNGPSADVPFLRPFDPSLPNDEQESDYSRPLLSQSVGPSTIRPTSYMNPETGQTMLYYPARVPVMLNVPQKLSKKPKAEVRNARRSQILDKMAETNRKSDAGWLPEYLPGPPLDPVGSNDELRTPRAVPNTEPQMAPALEGQFLPGHELVNDEARNKSRLSLFGIDKRKSKIPAGDSLPPQLRASAFFDLPSEVPAIELKDGSAMATLDSILDASAKAPVSAFTDHTFAGILGSEVYGTEKKRKSHLKRASAADLLVPKKRSSFLHLRKHSALSRHSESQEERRNTIAGGARTEGVVNDGNEQPEERQRLSSSIDGQAVPGKGEEDAGSEEEPLYNGQPTTLLAELQIRKQQQKLRTRPITAAYPNGVHSTLLEMDTVAQIERDARKGKKVNLAWEEPSMDPADNSDDDETPLGLLMVAKGQGNDMTAAIAEVNRPLGLMERREMEDNEPLSRRRDRLQGKEVGPMKRQSMMTLGQGLHNAGGNLEPPSPQFRVRTPEDDEVEGETLGERMRRLKAREQGDNPLPQARPVSSAFSTELLSQLGDAFKENGGDDGKQEKEKSQPKEEEETLGQRRRRLQAEREAHGRAMTSTMPTGGIGGDVAKLTKRHSLADVLGGHGSKTILHDPRAEAERGKREEAARYKQDQELKLAALRSQMPSSISTPNLNRSGGYLAGRFNDGTGGGIGQLRTSVAIGNAYPMNGIMGGTMPPYGAQNGYGTPMGTPYTMPMPLPPPGQMDRVERWRQSVLP
ncbi:hypothetical protein AAE478_006096 [Parahypoxylon ruwenzoriense]